MRVRRSELRLPAAIQRDRLVTGAKAMSASAAGKGSLLPPLRTKRPGPAGGGAMPGRTGRHTLAGASVLSSATFFGPVRRSGSAAIDTRQLLAIWLRWAGL